MVSLTKRVTLQNQNNNTQGPQNSCLYLIPLTVDNEASMSASTEEVELLPIATRTGFAELARDLVQQQHVDAVEGSIDAANPQAELLVQARRRSSQRKKSRQSHKRRQELLEPQKFDPTTGRRGYHSLVETTRADHKEQPTQRPDTDPDASFSRTECSTSRRSDISTAPTSVSSIRVLSGSYAHIIIHRGQKEPPGFRTPSQLEEYMKMDQTDLKKQEEEITAGYVNRGIPTITRASDEHDPRINSVYAQISSTNPFLYNLENHNSADEEMRATLFPSPSKGATNPHKTDRAKTPGNTQIQSSQKEQQLANELQSPNKAMLTPQSVASEWISAYDKIVSPKSDLPDSTTAVPLQDSSTRSRHNNQRFIDPYTHAQEYLQPRPSEEVSRRSPTKVSFASPSEPQNSGPDMSFEYRSQNMPQTRRANASPTRIDMNFKPLPQSPLQPHSDYSSFNPAQYYEYLAPKPLNIPGKSYIQDPAQAAFHERHESDEAYFNWFKANNVPQHQPEASRETLWPTPQPSNRYYLDDVSKTYAHAQNPQVAYHQMNTGPSQGAGDGEAMYRNNDEDPSPSRRDREIAKDIISKHEFNRLNNQPVNQKSYREMAEDIINQHEFNRLNNQSLNQKKHHKANSDVSEFGYHQRSSNGDSKHSQASLTKSQSQKHYRITPPEIAEYDHVTELETTPGGHTRVVSGRDRHSGSTTSGPRGRSAVRTRRSRSLSPAKKSFDVSGLPEDDEYVFCDEDPPPKRSRSPMKQMFGEKGWLHRGNSMNQVATPSPKKKGFKDFAKLVKQKTDEKKLDLAKKLGTDLPFDHTSPIHSRNPSATEPAPMRTGPAVSIPYSDQMRLYGELELLLQTVANSFLLSQKEGGHMSPSTVAKVAKAWHNKNRPQVLEFRFDLATQLDLAKLNSSTFRFHGRHADDPLHQAALFNSWKGIARELGVRTFCNPDAAVKKMLHDSYKVLEMLGAKTPFFLLLQHMQQKVLRRIEEEVVLKPRRERKGRVGVTKQVVIESGAGAREREEGAGIYVG